MQTEWAVAIFLAVAGLAAWWWWSQREENKAGYGYCRSKRYHVNAEVPKSQCHPADLYEWKND